MAPPNINDIVSGIGSGTGQTIGTVILISVVALILFIIVGGLFAFFWFKKRYNLVVGIKKVRSDGKMISAEIGKGIYNQKRGIVYLKRKGIRGHIAMSVFDVRKYLQGENWLDVLQVGPDDYRPILPSSWTEHVTEYQDSKGNIVQVKESILNIKVDLGANKAWKSAYEAASKKAYSIQSFISQFQVPISIAIVLIAVFAGFALLWSKVGSCG